MVWGLGFRVWGLGFRVWGLGFGVWGLGFKVWVLGFRVQMCRKPGRVRVTCRYGDDQITPDEDLLPSRHAKYVEQVAHEPR